MVNLNEIENDLVNKQKELEEKSEKISNLGNEYNEKLSELEAQYNSNVADLNAEIERLKGMKQTAPEGSTEEEIDDVNANNEEVDKKIEEVKQELKNAGENYQNSKNQLEEDRKREEAENETERENISENISAVKKQFLESIEQNREEAKQEEEKAKKIEEKAYEKFREKNKQIRGTKKNVENLKLSLDSLNKIEGSNVEEAKKQVLKAKKSEMQKLKNFAKSRTKLWEKYNEAYKNRQQAEKNTENIMKETEELIAKYSLSIELEENEESTEIKPEEQEEQQVESKEEDKQTKSKNEPILGYTAESLENETKRLKDQIRETFESKEIALGTELENKLYKRVENQYILFDKVLKMSKEFEEYKKWNIDDIVKDVLHVQEEAENREELLKVAEQLGITDVEPKGQTEPEEPAEPKEQTKGKINFTEEELKHIIEEQKNAVNGFFAEKGVTNSIIMTKILKDISIGQKEFLKIIKGETNPDISVKDFNEALEELKKSTNELNEAFKDEKKVGKMIDIYLHELRLATYMQPNKEALDKAVKEYNDFLVEAKNLQIPINDKFKLIEEKSQQKQNNQETKPNPKPVSSTKTTTRSTQTKTQQQPTEASTAQENSKNPKFTEVKRWIFNEKDVQDLVNGYQDTINEFFIANGFQEKDTSELRTQMHEMVNRYKNNYTQILQDTDNPEFDSQVINEGFYNLQKYLKNGAAVLMVANDAINSIRKQINEKEHGEEKDKLIDKYNNILNEAKLLRIPTVAKNIEKNQDTQKIDLEKITFFAKAGLYHFTFSDGTAVGVNQMYFMKRSKMKELQQDLMSQVREIRAIMHTPDFALIDALSSAMRIRNDYFKDPKKEFSIKEINTKIAKYADGVEYSHMSPGFTKIVYDNISKIPEIKEIQNKSLNGNKETLGKPGKSAKKIINKILKNAKAIKGIEVLGPVGRFGKLRYLIESYILKNCLSAPKRQEQLKEETANIKTAGNLNYAEQKQEFDSNIKATEKQKQDMKKITRQYAEKEQEGDILDGEWKPLEDNSREENE